ncbi:MAG: outer membrane protein assembly factor BamA [Myxococcota bacterium]|nr:outer membrane protein assembly factor BamA [Myxococcota bacterium]
MNRSLPVGLHAVVLACAVALGAAHGAGAPAARAQAEAAASVVRGVEIRGLNRVDRANVRAKIYSQVGQVLDRIRVSEDIKRIYRMGFFEDVDVATVPAADGGVILHYRVKERPTIVAVTYDIRGDELDEEELSEVVNLKRFDILDEGAIKRNLRKIRERYEEDGFYLVDTSYTLEKVSPQGVQVTLKVDEGDPVEVRHVNIVGNIHVPTDEIKGVMMTKEGGYFSFLTQTGKFKEELLDVDSQRVQQFLGTKGFAKARADRPTISLSADRKSLTLTLRVDEGGRFTISKVDVDMLGGEWIIPREELMAMVEVEPGSVFDLMKLSIDAQKIGDAFKDMGYANAGVSFRDNTDDETRRIELTYTIQPGVPVRIRRIEIRGNRVTRDKVIRRELKLAEGDLFSVTSLRRSQMRLQSLGFFERAQIIPKRTEDEGLIDLEIEVKERSTGQFQIGAGFSSAESFMFTANIAKENFMGRGQRIALNAMIGGIRKQFSMNFHEPYFFDTRWDFGINIYNQSIEYPDYSRSQSGGSFSWGYRFTDELLISLAYTLEHINVNIRSTSIPLNIAKRNGLTSSLRATAVYDTRDNRLFPTSGTYTSFSTEYADEWLGSENRFIRLIGSTRFYVPLFWDIVFKTNTTAGYVRALDDNPIPLYQRFQVGGIFTVRGFERNSIGEELYVADHPDSSLRPFDLGGVKKFIFNAELEIPIFKEAGILGVAFFDAGNAWGDHETFNPIDLRTSMGFGFRWHSPVGPLRFEWGFPLAPRKGEDPVVFEFTIGNSF